MIKSRKMIRAGHTGRTGGKFKVFVGKPGGKKT
jgi:hypothetical protein